MIGVEGVRTVHETLPDPIRDLFAVVTHLGEPALLGFAVIGFYLLTDNRETGSYVVGVAIGGAALTTGLKGVFARPRPPEELHAVAESGYAFPSGHALGATVVFLLFAEVLDIGTRRARYTAAVLGIVLVSFSRIAVGVHHPIDAIAGVVLGAVYLGVVSWHGRNPEVAFSAALTVAVVGVALGSDYRLPVGVGLPLGGYLGWHLVVDRYDFSEVVRDPDAVLVALLPAVAVGLVAPAGGDVLLETAFYAAGTAVVVSLPATFASPRPSHQAS